MLLIKAKEIMTDTPASHLSAVTAALMVVSRLNIDTLFKDEVALGLILVDNASLYKQGFVFVVEAEENKAKSTAALGQLLSHHNGVLNLAKVSEVAKQVVL